MTGKRTNRPDFLVTCHSISGYEERRNAALSPLMQALEVAENTISDADDWNAIPLAQYLSEEPYSYFFEPTFTEMYRFLNVAYGQDPAGLLVDASASGRDFWFGIVAAESRAIDVHTTTLSDMSKYKAVKQFLHPWYLDIFEQAFANLVNLPAFYLHRQAGRTLTSKLWPIYEAIKSHGWVYSAISFDGVVRNGIAHHNEFLVPDASGPLSIQYKDSNNHEAVRSYEDLITDVHDALDECLAYCFAYRLFLFENRDQLPSVSASSIREAERARLLIGRVGSETFVVENIWCEKVGGQLQVRFECLDRTFDDGERVGEVVSIFSTAAAWYPDARFFFLSAKSKSEKTGFARIEAGYVRQWLKGEMDVEDFFSKFDPFALWPREHPLLSLKIRLPPCCRNSVQPNGTQQSVPRGQLRRLGRAVGHGPALGIGQAQQCGNDRGMAGEDNLRDRSKQFLEVLQH